MTQSAGLARSFIWLKCILTRDIIEAKLHYPSVGAEQRRPVFKGR